VLAVVCRDPGAIAHLVVEEMDPPTPSDDQILVDVVSSGVNYVDALFVEGRYQIKPQPPFIPGSEAAGVVAAVGGSVRSISVGDRVLVSCGLGGFAEQIVASGSQVTKIPDNLSLDAAACFTQSYSTALFTLNHRASLRPGERVLVLGGGGGVGLASVQVAKALGAEVFATGSTQPKRDAAVAAGADVVIDGEPLGLKDRVRSVAQGGVDVVLDPVGGAATSEALRTLHEFGRLAIIGFAAGAIPELAANQILLRNRAVVGVDWGAWAMTHPSEQELLLERLLEMVSNEVISPPEPTTYPLDRVIEALDDLVGRRVVGKVALKSA
jgi:NADPH2:quinone reductase